MKDKDIKTVVPALRFPEFRDAEGWYKTLLGTISSITNGKANVQDHIEGGKYPLFDRSAVVKSTDNYLFDCEAVIIPGEGMKFAPKYHVGKFNLHQRAYALKNFACIGLYIYYLMEYSSDLLSANAVKSTVLSLRLPILQNFPIQIPQNTKEQQKIADCLGSLDDLISAVVDKIEVLKLHKKGLMQQLFPAEGKTTPTLRFPQFQNAPDWQETTLGECLDYEQPTPYLVSDTNYSNDYKTPVLTAGKSFILGYTNEPEGIFNHFLPVIIFDDFTTATQFVDFPFKVKSSAMKILRAKNDVDIKFMYEAMKTISYQVGVHERHWISRFSPMIVITPESEEQRKTAVCLSSVDELISTETDKLNQLKAHKKGLMQQLFPRIDSI